MLPFSLCFLFKEMGTPQSAPPVAEECHIQGKSGYASCSDHKSWDFSEASCFIRNKLRNILCFQPYLPPSGLVCHFCLWSCERKSVFTPAKSLWSVFKNAKCLYGYYDYI